MTSLRALLAKVRALFTRQRDDRALGEEMRAHLDDLADDYQRRGLSPDAARRAARVDFGGVVQVREAYADARRLPLLEGVAQDLRFALRALRRSPAFAAAAIGALALSIGANVAIFGLVDALLLRSLPVSRPDELVALSGEYSFQSFKTLAEQSRDALPLLATAGVENLEARVADGFPERVQVSFVSGAYFSVLDVPPVAGRTLMPGDDRVIGAPAIAVLSDDYWRRRFAGDRAVVGRTVHIAGAPIAIAGIAPPGFTGERVGSLPDLWVPLTMRTALVSGRDLLRSPTTSWLTLVGRVRSGQDPAETATSLTHQYRQILAGIFGPDLPDDVRRDLALTTIAFTPAGRGLSSLRGRFGDPLWVLMAVVLLILLIACANVANLLLARGAARRREIGLRLALGITRRRLLRQLLTEAALLSLIGAAAGLVLAWPARELLLHLVSADGSRVPLLVRTDLHTLAFVLIVSVVTTLLFGLAPAWNWSRADALSALGTPRHAKHRWIGSAPGSLLLIGQVTISMVLLVGAGLFLKSLSNLRHADLGFATAGRLIIDIDPRAIGYRGRAYADFSSRMVDRLRAVPGVTSATLSENGALMGRDSSTDRLRPDDYVPGPEGIPKSYFDIVGPDYLTTMGVPLVAGRGITEQDRIGSPSVVVINEALARQFFGETEPVGRRMRWQDLNLLVVGVTRNVNYGGPRVQPRPRFYIAYFQHADRAELASARFIVSTSADPASLVRSIEAAIHLEDARLPAPDIRIASHLVDRLFAQERMLAKLSGAFAGLALSLTSVGLYGLMAYRVARRTSEIGIRMALGASRLHVLWMVVREELALILVGLGAGLPVAVAACRLIASLLFDVGAADPVTIVLAAATMVGVGLVAALIPTRRAVAIQPTIALRHE